jgi:hypothetical protein
MQLVMAQARLAGATIIGGKVLTEVGDDGRAAARASQQELAQTAATRSHQQFLDTLKNSDKKAGGARLSDQTKLSNTLATDQQKGDQQAETAEAQHQQKLLDLAASYAEKRAKAQTVYDQATLDSRAGFYGQMGQIESAGIQKASSDAYESAVNKSREIAASKGADVGNAYMAAQEAVILARAQRQQAIETALAAAKQDKSKRGEAEYLQGVDSLYRRSEDAKLAAAASGQDSLASQQQAALADEQAQYQQQLDQLGTKVANAADLRIAAAQRAGKAVDVEALSVDGLAASYGKLGIAAARGAAPGATPAAVTPAATTPAAVGASKGQLVQAPDVTNAIETGNDRLSRVEGRLGDVIGAIQDVAKRVSGVEGAIGGLKASGGVS